MLTCFRVSLAHGQVRLLHDLSFTLLSGACLQIVGARACSKTSLLRIIARLNLDHQGEIHYFNQPVDTHLREYYSLITYIPAEVTLDYSLTVARNLEFWAKVYDSEVKLAAAGAAFDLIQWWQVRVENLSKSWQKRVALARLCLTNTKIWLLDKPFAHLNHEGREILTNIIKARCANRGIVIFTSHKLEQHNFGQQLILPTYS